MVYFHQILIAYTVLHCISNTSIDYRVYLADYLLFDIGYVKKIMINREYSNVLLNMDFISSSEVENIYIS